MFEKIYKWRKKEINLCVKISNYLCRYFPFKNVEHNSFLPKGKLHTVISFQSVWYENEEKRVNL